ncbi:uncharacterized protein METZ01_LOCUS373735, partial [marine metagenome]
ADLIANKKDFNGDKVPKVIPQA